MSEKTSRLYNPGSFFTKKIRLNPRAGNLKVGGGGVLKLKCIDVKRRVFIIN